MVRTAPTDAPTGGLALLVETEERLEAWLAERREEADRLIEEARCDAAARLAALAEGLAGEEAAIRAEVAEGARAAAEAAAAAAERRARGFRELPEERVAALADLVVERVLSAPERGS